VKELLPYLQARTEAIGNMPQQNRGSILEGHRASIENAVANVVPEYGKAKRRLSQAEKALQVTEYNAKAIRDRFAIAAPGAYRKPMFVDASKYDPDAA
jgi:hypothetical protein